MIKINPIKKYFLDLASMLRTNIRDYGMYIALISIFLVFTIMTGGTFLTPYNFTNLLNQTAYVAVLAVGMTLIIVTRQIDLSVGYLGAFLGAMIVAAVENKGQNIVLALITALIVSLIIGFIKGFFVAKVKVPSFVVTLAGMFVFKGLLMVQTQNKVISASSPFFKKIGSQFLLGDFKIGPLNGLALLIGIAAVVLVVTLGIIKRNKNRKMSIPNEQVSIFMTKQLFLLIVIGFLVYQLSVDRGISYLVFITIIVVLVYHFVTTKTVIGRRIYAIGGNPEAAELSGISVKSIIILVFLSMSVLSLIAGLMYVSMLSTASPLYGPSWELYAIAATYIGGTSASGGMGKIINAVVGAIVIMALRNGMAVAGLASNIEPIVLGSVLLLAVVFDIYTRNVREIDLVGVHYAKQKHGPAARAAKVEYLELRVRVRELRKINIEDPDLLELEYELTRKLAAYNNIKDKIRAAKEEDYVSQESV